MKCLLTLYGQIINSRSFVKLVVDLWIYVLFLVFLFFFFFHICIYIKQTKKVSEATNEGKNAKIKITLSEGGSSWEI